MTDAPTPREVLVVFASPLAGTLYSESSRVQPVTVLALHGSPLVGWQDGRTALTIDAHGNLDWIDISGLVLAATPAEDASSAETLAALREAANDAVTKWNDYIEAHAGRGHAGPHEPEPNLGGDCGPCASAEYGTEVEMAEYVIPALRAALAATPDEDTARDGDVMLDAKRYDY